ncbi:Uncharacterised protein [Bordetella pertussis]|nr:Uncharacterised protein [Bordetella pertussis]
MSSQGRRAAPSSTGSLKAAGGHGAWASRPGVTAPANRQPDWSISSHPATSGMSSPVRTISQCGLAPTRAPCTAGQRAMHCAPESTRNSSAVVIDPPCPGAVH